MTLGLGCLFSIIAIVKVMINNQSTVMKVLSKFFIMIVSVFVVLIGMLMIFLISDKILDYLKNIWQIEYNFSLTKIIFDNAVMEWNNDYSINEIDFSICKSCDILGTYQVDGFIPIKWNGDGMINPNNFQYLPCFLTVIISGGALLILFIRLIKRLYEIILLYLVMPVSVSSLPLDDGLAFKNWLEIFISKFLIVYASIIILNLFLFMFPLINEFDLLVDSSYVGLSKLLMIMGTMVCLPIGQVIFSKIFKNIKNTKQNIIKENNIIYSVNDINNEQITHRYVDDNIIDRRG